MVVVVVVVAVASPAKAGLVELGRLIALLLLYSSRGPAGCKSTLNLPELPYSRIYPLKVARLVELIPRLLRSSTSVDELVEQIPILLRSSSCSFIW